MILPIICTCILFTSVTYGQVVPVVPGPMPPGMRPGPGKI